ncbi:hypothetical protein WAX88_09050 [Photobacterium damselae subsp. damselae]|uniref:hypothetical protein n=1 Tax=Photobacterium damselae TaxID=38293 RepID=UPI00311B16A4
MIRNKMDSFKNFIRNKFFNKSPIYSIGNYEGKRVLVSYLTDGFNKDHFENYNTNRIECSYIVNWFVINGYCVDIADCNDIGFKGNVSYDVIFGFGAPFNNSHLTSTGKKILYCTEAHPNFSFKEESDRCIYFYERHNIKHPLVRSGTYYKSEDYQDKYSYIVLGDRNSTYLVDQLGIESNKVKTIYPTGIEPLFDLYVKDSDYISRDILWLGSRGLIHKGLDILIESFIYSKVECKLHVCGITYKQFKSIYKDINLDLHNVIFYGKVDVRTSKFETILKKCGFISLLSCSEACSTGVTTGMRHALIPIVTKSCDVNVDGLGFYIEGKDIPSIASELSSIINEDNKLLSDMSKRSKIIANDLYSIEHFKNSINMALSSLI